MNIANPVDSVNANPVIQQKQNESSSDDTGFSALLAQAGEIEDDAQQDTSGLSMCRVLTNEEEKRLAELQDQLRQCLMDMVDNPSDETKRRIREIEEEIAELTGVKNKHKLADTAKKLPLEDDKDEEERKARPMSRKLAKELGVRPVPSDMPDSDSGIMDFYQQNLAAYLAVAPTDDL